MAKFKWRWSDFLPVPIQVFLAVISLVIMVSILTFTLMPEDHWGDGFSSLFFDAVASRSKNITSDSLPTALLSSSWAPLAVTPSPSILTVFGENNAISSANSASPIAAVMRESRKNLSAGMIPSSSLPLSTNDLPSLVYSEATPAPKSSALSDEREKFLVPLLSRGAGAGNQMMEYLSAIVIARSINRTVCLPPFWTTKKHNGLSVRVRGGFMWEDRFDVSSLSRFTKVASLKHCLQQCKHTLDSTWLLHWAKEPLVRDWKHYHRNNESWDLNWSYVKWQSPGDIDATLGSYKDHCVGLSGLFPGLRWRGAFLAVSAYLQPALPIYEAANILQTCAIGKDTPYLAVHWRFEETRCPAHQIGLCFMRCHDGAVVDTGLHPVTKEWLQITENQCNRRGHFMGVGIDKMDLVAAIEDRAINQSLKTVYLATDGWSRGPESLALVNETVLLLRNRGLKVVGLWSIPGLPNFSDGTYYNPYVTLGKEHVINGLQIAQVEQELCARAVVFLGSGHSTWSLAVFRVRLAQRRSEQILEKHDNANNMDQKARDELVIQTLMEDQHPAGWHCHFIQWMSRAIVNETVETFADEFPDGWLDLEACEGRIGRGGRCEVAKCY